MISDSKRQNTGSPLPGNQKPPSRFHGRATFRARGQTPGQASFLFTTNKDVLYKHRQFYNTTSYSKSYNSTFQIKHILNHPSELCRHSELCRRRSGMFLVASGTEHLPSSEREGPLPGGSLRLPLQFSSATLRAGVGLPGGVRGHDRICFGWAGVRATRCGARERLGF